MSYWWCGRCAEKVCYLGCGCENAMASPWWYVPTAWHRLRCFFKRCPGLACIYCNGWDEIRARFREKRK